MTLQKAAMTTWVVAMNVELINSFDSDASGGCSTHTCDFGAGMNYDECRDANYLYQPSLTVCLLVW